VLDTIFKTLNLDLNNNSLNFYNNPFSLSPAVDMDLVGNFTYLVIYLFLILYFIFLKLYTKMNYSISLLWLIGLQLLTYSILFRWQPWGNRFLYIPIILIVVLAANTYRNITFLPKFLLILITIPSLLLGVFLTLHNPGRVLIASDYLKNVNERFAYSSSLSKSILDQESKTYNYYWDEAKQIIKFLETSGETGAYIYLGESGYEYPLWRAGNFDLSFPHFPSNSGERKYDYLLCNYTCEVLSPKITIVKEYGYFKLAQLN
jgi:hypothetical protein